MNASTAGNDVSRSVPRGEVVCIIGPAGAGKSTLLRCINRLESMDEGSIHFEGKPVYRYQENGKTVVDPANRGGPRADRHGVPDRAGQCNRGADRHHQAAVAIGMRG